MPNAQSFSAKSCLRKAVVLALAGMFLACASATRVEAQSPARRIVSTAPSETEALFAMGLGQRVVGVSQYCEWPAEVKTLPKVGTYLKPDLEAITRLRPDLVFLERASTDTSSRLTAVGMHVVAVPHGSLAETLEGIRVMARAAGEPARGEELIARIQSALAAVRDAAARLPKVRVVVVVDRRPGLLADIVAVGPGGYLNELITMAGGVNVLATPGVPPYPRISLETILRDDPDVIVDLSDAHETDAAHLAARVADRQLWARETGLRAVRQGHVTLAETSEFVVPGPRSVDAARKMFLWFHGRESGK
jgi:iron complex transport system substrate-binding protein